MLAVFLGNVLGLIGGGLSSRRKEVWIYMGLVVKGESSELMICKRWIGKKRLTDERRDWGWEMRMVEIWDSHLGKGT